MIYVLVINIGNNKLKFIFITHTIRKLLTFLGPLRPHRTSPARTVPGHIQRPDYADHPDGTPLSEQSVKLSSHIKVLNDEEQEEMIIACKVFRYLKFQI